MTKRSVVALVIGGVLAVVLVVSAIVVMGWRIVQYNKARPDPRPITEAEKRLVPTAEDLARLGGPAVDRAAEKWSALRQGNTNRFVLYLYEPKGEPRISLYSRLVIMPDADDAQRWYSRDKAKPQSGSSGESYVPAPQLFPGGGDRSAWFIEKDGRKIGNLLLLCDGRHLRSVRIIGFVLIHPSDVQTLLERASP